MQRMTWAIAGLACFLAGAATGQENGRVVKLQAEVDALEAAIDAYRTASGAVAPAEFERSAELHALVSDVLADADQRAAFARGGTTAGYLDGFVLTSADGNFLLRLNGLVQTRYLLNSIDAPSGADGTRAGFDVKRTELVFSGNLFGPELQYEIVADQTTDGTLVTDLSSLDPNDAAALGRLGYQDVTTAPGASSPQLYKAWMGRSFGAWAMRAGQFSTGFLRENTPAYHDDQAVERSLVNQIYKVDVVQGVEARYSTDLWRLTAAFHDGAGATNTAALNSSTDFAVTVRAETILLGTWEQQHDLWSPADGETGLLLGGGVHYQRGESGSSAPEQDIVQWTVDASLELGGPNVLAAVIGRRVDEGEGGFLASQVGVLVQAGWSFGTWNPFVRYEWSDLDVPGLADLSVVTAGVMCRLGPRLAWTTDLMIGLDPVPLGSPLVGLRADTPGADGQIVFRTQVGLGF